jgi:large subunit ribosomal protein L10
LKGAFVEQSYYGADQLDALVSLKSKNELIADIVALLQSPAKNVISGLKASAGDKILGELETLSKR